MSKVQEYFGFALLVTGLLILISCEDTMDDEKLDAQETAMLGSWEATTVEVMTEATTNIDQDIVMALRPGIGEISISGDFTARITHFFAFDFDGVYAIYAGNQSIGGNALPDYSLVISIGSPDNESLTLIVDLVDSTQYVFSTGEFVATFDLATLTLGLSDITVFTADSALSISMGGQLQLNQVHIPANQATQFNYREPIVLSEIGLSQTIVIQDNHDVEIISTEGESGNVQTQSATWSLGGDELTFTFDNGDGEVELQEFIVTFEDDVLTLAHSRNCQDRGDEATCLNEMESFYGFDAGSLVELIETEVYYLSKTN